MGNIGGSKPAASKPSVLGSKPSFGAPKRGNTFAKPAFASGGKKPFTLNKKDIKPSRAMVDQDAMIEAELAAIADDNRNFESPSKVGNYG